MTLLSPDYVWFWLAVAAVVCVVFAVPLYGIWYEQYHIRKALEKKQPLKYPVDDLYDTRVQ